MLESIITGENVFLFLAVFLAFFVKAITGFGNTLVMGSLFSFVVPNTITTPVDLLMSIPTNGYIAWRERSAILLKKAIPLSLLMMIGLIPGTFFLTMGEDWLLRALLGLVIVGMALQIARGRRGRGRGRGREGAHPEKCKTLVLILTGLFSGILAGLFGIGALVAIYFSKRAESKQELRSSTCFVFFLENIFRVILYFATGILNRQIFLITLALTPAVILGMAVGRNVDKYINDEKMKGGVIVLLIISGATLFIRNVFFR